MAITPGPGYMVDPNNPNAVVPIGSSAQAQGLGSYAINQGAQASTPGASATQLQAPAAPVATTNAPTAPISPAGQLSMQTQGNMQGNTQGQVQTSSTGSIVDLLNQAGQDSSFAARQQLAKQFGVQNYQGSATQNQELSKKFIDAFNAAKGTQIPQTSADGRTAVSDILQNQQSIEPQQGTPVQQMMDIYGSMNPIEANIFQQLSNLLSTQSTQQSFTDLYKQEMEAQGIPELQLQFADIKKIMDGTEDDIRSEITSAGGFVTESQVQALTGARNKGLLKQAQYLSDVINAKNDYVDRIVSLTQADREQVDRDLTRKLGITNTLLSISQSMQNNARGNYESIVKSVGWGGLAQMVKGNTNQAKMIESIFGLDNGELETLANYQKPLSKKEELELENQRLQNLRLQKDLSEIPSVSTQVVDLNGKKVLINSKTGAVVANIEGEQPQDSQRLAVQQQTITDTDSLLKSPGLNSAVGPNMFSRIPVVDAFGNKSNFIAGVEQLRQQLTLEQLVKAKGQGATFGALSDTELQLISASASKIGTWAVKDKAGNVMGYSANEKDFKKELDKINNFQKLDFIIKGGDPASVGVQQMADGTYWVKNSDSTYSKIR